MFFGIVVMLVVCIGIPLVYSWRMGRMDVPTKSVWTVLAADAVLFVTLVFLVGRWDITGYYTRFTLIAVFIATLLWSLKRHASRAWRVEGQDVFRQHWSSMISVVLFGGVLCYVGFGQLPPQEPRALGLPLEGGRFMVGQAGSIGLLNHHAGHPAQHYAADFTALNGFGFRASRLASKALDNYVIYGASVISPCTGEIIEVRSELPDLIPPKTDRGNPRGNHVVIDCGDVHITLAHLLQGSVRVSAGASVVQGQAIGKVGNSGNTTEPHLHVDAVDPHSTASVPMSFNGRVPVRNALYVN